MRSGIRIGTGASAPSMRCPRPHDPHDSAPPPLVAAGPLPHGRGPTDGPAFAADRAVDVARAATAAGLEVCAVVAGSDRDQPGTERMGRLAEVTGRAVHRIDARLMPTPVLQRIVARVTEGSDLCLIVAPESISDEDPLGAGLFDLARGLDAPSVLCADLARGREAVTGVREALRRLERVEAGRDGGPLVLAAECPEGRVGEGLAAGARCSPRRWARAVCGSRA